MFYGPPMAGKGTALAYLHRALRVETRGQIVSVTTGGDRTIFFDFFPQPTPRLRGSGLRVQIYAAPGEIHSESTRRSLLEDVKGIIFLADSQRSREEDNVRALDQLRESLLAVGHRLEQLPHVFAWNKRDLPLLLTPAELSARLNVDRMPAFDAVATQGRGIFDALKAVTSLVLGDMQRRAGGGAGPTTPPAGATTAPLGAGATAPPAAATGSPSLSPRPRTVAVSEPLAAQPTAILPAREELLVPSSAETSPRRLTWLQPLAPELFEPEPSAEPRPVWLSRLIPPGPMRDQIHEIEADLAAGQSAQAVRRARNLFVGLTALDAGREPEEGQAWRALVLGLPVDRYLRFREAARSADAGTASQEDGLFALFFLLDAVLRR